MNRFLKIQIVDLVQIDLFSYYCFFYLITVPFDTY
jgi:hypothetical protein